MGVVLPLSKKSWMIPVEYFDQNEGEKVVREEEATYRDDGGNLMMLLTQIDFGTKKHRRHLEKAHSIGVKFREFNFEHDNDKAYEETMEVEYEEAKYLHDLIVKETLQVRGMSMIETVMHYKNWFAEQSEPEDE